MYLHYVSGWFRTKCRMHHPDKRDLDLEHVMTKAFQPNKHTKQHLWLVVMVCCAVCEIVYQISQWNSMFEEQDRFIIPILYSIHLHFQVTRSNNAETTKDESCFLSQN